MKIIERLKYHDNNQLDEWMMNSEKEERKFIEDLVKFSNENPNAIKQYCQNTLPSEFSSLSIVYEALSEYSSDWNEFLFEEVQRVIKLAKSRRIEASFMEVLSDIETRNIYAKDRDMYINMLNFMTSNLKLSNESKFTVELLGLIKWFLVEFDEANEVQELKEGLSTIKTLANDGELAVKIKARKALKDAGSNETFTPLTFMEKLKGFFQ